MNFGTLIKHDEMMCHAKEQLLLAYLWSYFPLIIFHTILCLLYNSKTIRDFSMKHGTLIKHDETMCFITLAFISLELFPFDYFPYNFVPAL